MAIKMERTFVTSHYYGNPHSRVVGILPLSPCLLAWRRRSLACCVPWRWVTVRNFKNWGDVPVIIFGWPLIQNVCECGCLLASSELVIPLSRLACIPVWSATSRFRHHIATPSLVVNLLWTGHPSVAACNCWWSFICCCWPQALEHSAWGHYIYAVFTGVPTKTEDSFVSAILSGYYLKSSLLSMWQP